MARDYKDEYKKFQSSPSSIKKRVKLNKINRDKGTYGNGDGKDNSHVRTTSGNVVIIVKNAGDNRGSKNDMPGDSRARGSFSAARGKRVYQNKYMVTAGKDNEFRSKPHEERWKAEYDAKIKRMMKDIKLSEGGYASVGPVRKAGSGAIYSRGFDYYGGGPLYGHSAGAAALAGGTNTAAGMGAGGGGGKGGNPFGDKRKDAKTKEKGGTTVNERRALRKAKKAVRVASREAKRSGDPRVQGEHGPAGHAKKNLAKLQTMIQNDTFTAQDNVKPWFKSSKSWEKDKYNRINSAQAQRKKWEKANPDTKWTGTKHYTGESDILYYSGTGGDPYKAGYTRSSGKTRPFKF